jgi:hypothetical protein
VADAASDHASRDRVAIGDHLSSRDIARTGNLRRRQAVIDIQAPERRLCTATRMQAMRERIALTPVSANSYTP